MVFGTINVFSRASSTLTLVQCDVNYSIYLTKLIFKIEIKKYKISHLSINPLT